MALIAVAGAPPLRVGGGQRASLHTAEVAVDRVLHGEGDRLRAQIGGEVLTRDQGFEAGQRVQPEQVIDRADRVHGTAHSCSAQMWSSADCSVGSPARWA